VCRKLRGRHPGDPSYEDVRQDAAVLVMECAGRLAEKPEGVERDAWLVQRAWGMLMDRRQQSAKRHAATEQRAKSFRGDDSHCVPSHAPGCDMRADVEAALAKLSPTQAEAARAVLLDGWTQAEYARHKGVSEAAVSKTLARARAELAEHLKDYADEG
jgi:RNA polymerase sigma factor (sigma-70 family)